MWIAVELTTLLSAFLVGFRGHAGGARGRLEICGADDARRGHRPARLSHPLLGLARRRGFAVHLGRPGRRGAAHAARASVARLSVHPRGLRRKVGLVPMHTWLPDAHSQAPASICALLSGVETTAVLYVILRLFPVIGGVAGARCAAVVRRLWACLGRHRRAAPGPGEGLQADVRLLDRRAHGHHPGRGRPWRRRGASRRRLSNNWARHCEILLLFRRGRVIDMFGTQDIASVRGIAFVLALCCARSCRRGVRNRGGAAFCRLRQRIRDSESGRRHAATICRRSAGLLCRGRILRDHVPYQPHGLRSCRRPNAPAPVSRHCLARRRLLAAAIPLLAIGVYVPWAAAEPAYGGCRCDGRLIGGEMSDIQP